MDKAFLSGIFRDIILRDGELILPFMGCIKLEDVPASFSEGGLVVAPPSKKLYFDNYSLSSNDNLLNEYATRLEVSRMAAKRATSCLCLRSKSLPHIFAKVNDTANA